MAKSGAIGKAFPASDALWSLMVSKEPPWGGHFSQRPTQVMGMGLSGEMKRVRRRASRLRGPEQVTGAQPGLLGPAAWTGVSKKGPCSDPSPPRAAAPPAVLMARRPQAHLGPRL